MIILKSDYSPESAQPLQEVDNIKMLKALLLLAGLPQDQLDKFNDLSTQAAIDYEKALGEMVDDKHTEEQWAAAKEAARVPMGHADQILCDNLIRIENTMIKSEQDGYYSHIQTTVYQNSEEVARIERPVIDIEAESYEDNSMGLSHD